VWRPAPAGRSSRVGTGKEGQEVVGRYGHRRVRLSVELEGESERQRLELVLLVSEGELRRSALRHVEEGEGRRVGIDRSSLS
jgi:hypothetical protein